MKIKKIISGIMKTNTYIVWCEDTKIGVVIDPSHKVNDIMKIVKDFNLKIEYIFNTHFHADHTCGNRKIKSLTGAKLLISKYDLPYLRQIINSIKLATFSFSLSPIPDIIIEEEINILVGNLNFKIFHTPGHTPGGLCFYVNGILFTGDTLFVGDSGATSFKGGNRLELGKSLRKIMKELPGDTIIYPGHDYGITETSTLDWEKRNNINAKEYGFYVEN